jgi:hypothetical protein
MKCVKGKTFPEKETTISLTETGIVNAETIRERGDEQAAGSVRWNPAVRNLHSSSKVHANLFSVSSRTASSNGEYRS